MNIQERNQYIGLHNQLVDLGKLNDNLTGEFINANNYWEKLNRPPIYQYIPQYVFNKLHEYLNNKRLYNRPKERFKLVNELLEPIGLKPLASGTNRRTFYCTYDPNIVFKLASDSVGMSDNLNEFTMQNLLKPFFAKMFSVTPDGLMSLSERVETMKEVDYKLTWSEYIFQIINDLLSRGYIMEDIGSNFFKNWGIRIGYGPVLLDCPYIYKVDRAKLKCPKIINRITKETCNGDIDYNYEKGMSEIVCTKCGTRYYASELAEIYPSESFTKIVKGRDYRMSMIDTNVKVQITKGDQIVNRYFIETDSQEFSNNQGPRRVTIDDFTPTNNISNFPHMQTNIHSVVTNVTHNIPGTDTTSVYNISDYPTNVNLFSIEMPSTLINTIRTNCNIDLTKMSENEIYNCFTKNTTQEFWISHMSTEEYKIFSEFVNKFVSDYLNKINRSSSGNGDPLINIFGAYIYKSLLHKIERILNFSFSNIPDVNVLYNYLTNETNNTILRSNLVEKEYTIFKSFIATLVVLNIDKISLINSEFTSSVWDLVKLCNNPINKALYNKLEQITKLNFSTITNNDNLVKYFIRSKNEIISQLTETEGVQFQYFIESLSSNQNGEIINTTPLLKSEQPSINIPQQQFPAIPVVKENISESKTLSAEEQQKELEKLVTTTDIDKNTKPEKLIRLETTTSTSEIVDDLNKELAQRKGLNLDDDGNTIGKIADWTNYYRNYIKYTLYPKDVKNDIIYFLKKIENKYGYTAAQFIAKKLELKYIKADEYDKDKNQASIKPSPITTSTETKRDVEISSKTTSDSSDILTNSQNKSEDKASTKYTISEQTEVSPAKKMINPEIDWKTRDEKSPINEATIEIDPDKEYFVEKAKTPEELSALAESKLQGTNSVTGIIGEPRVDALRNKELIPILKEKIFTKFNNIELDDNLMDVQLKDLQKYIKYYIFEEMKLITRDDGSGIDVELKRSADERNRDCFRIYVKNNNTTLFEVIIYPMKDISLTDHTTIRDRAKYIEEEPDFDVRQFLSNEKQLYEFLEQKLKEYDLSTLKTPEEAQSILIAYLYSELIDHVKGKASSPLIMSICKDYIINKCQITSNDSEQEKIQEEKTNNSVSLVEENDGNTIEDQI